MITKKRLPFSRGGYPECVGFSNPLEEKVRANVRRLIFISSMGIYGEVPGEKYRSVLDPYRDAARVIEESDLDYTILRPGWFTDEERTDYELTQKGEPFRGHDVARKSLATLIVRLATTLGLEVRRSVGVSNP